jgi:hypothetical protein
MDEYAPDKIFSGFSLKFRRENADIGVPAGRFRRKLPLTAARP